MNSEDDLIMWPDGSTCGRHCLHEFAHKGNDYRVIPVNSFEWEAIHDEYNN